MATDSAYEKAKRKVQQKRGFYKHLSAYMTVWGIFIFLYVFFWVDARYFMIPLGSWGIGVFFHYFGVFGFPLTSRFDESWEESEIEKEMRKTYRGKSELPMPAEDSLELKEIKKEKLKNYDDSEFV